MKKGFTLANETQKAFTLIELLVVISIIGILAGLSVFGLQGARQSSRDARRKADLETIRSGLEIYKADCGHYPDSLNGGDSLQGECPTENTYISMVPVDPISGYSYDYYPLDDAMMTYSLCATLEQPAGFNYCVSNP